MSIHNSFDILNNVRDKFTDIKVLSVLKKITEKFEDSEVTPSVTSEVTPIKTTEETPIKTTEITPIKTTEDDEKKLKENTDNTEYLIKWAFIGFAIFASLLILFSIIYYVFFSYTKNPENIEEYKYTQYYPKQSSLSKYENEQPESSSYDTKEISKQYSNKPESSSYDTKELSKQYSNKPESSSYDTKEISKQYSNKPESSSYDTKEISKQYSNKPESSSYDIFSSKNETKNSEIQTDPKIVGGKKIKIKNL